MRSTDRVSLGPLDPTQVRIVLTAEAKDVQYDAIAPVRSDGTFAIDGQDRSEAVVLGAYGVTHVLSPVHRLHRDTTLASAILACRRLSSKLVAC